MTIHPGRTHTEEQQLFFCCCFSSASSCSPPPASPASLLLLGMSFSFLQSLMGMRPADPTTCVSVCVCVRVHVRGCWSSRAWCVSMSGCRCEERGERGAEGEGTRGEERSGDGWRKGGTGGDCLTWSLSSHIPLPQSQSIHFTSPLSSLSRPQWIYFNFLSL